MPASFNDILIVAACLLGAVVLGLPAAIRALRLLKQRLSFPRDGAAMAWWYREYAKEPSAEDRASYAAEEEVAKATRSGLWRDAKPVTPWEWRVRLSR
jgi:hypothetical protein